jgi:hypothetical protein
VGRKKGCDDHRERTPSQELETKRKRLGVREGIPNYHYLTLYVYQLIEVWGRGMLRDGRATVYVKKELVSFVYCTLLSNKESA